MTQQKLLYIINHMDWFWSHRLPLAQAAQHKNWRVSIAASGAGLDEGLEAQGFEGLDLPRGHFLHIVYRIHKILRAEKPDLMHAMTLKYAFLAGLAGRLHPKTRIVHTIAGLGYLFSGEGWKPQLLRFLIGPILRLALKSRNTFLIFQNPDDRALMISRRFIDAQHTFLVRGSGVDLQQFAARPLPDHQFPIVLMPTRLVHDKGVAVFIEAARILETRGIQARFQIAGGVSASNPLAISESEITSMIAGSPVEWLGKVDDMPRLYAQASLIAYPSYYGEGIPKVLLEAAASGRAIVTTDHPGCREAVRNGDNGLLVPVKNAAAVADAVQRLLQNPGLLKLMGERGRLKAEAEFDVHMIAQQTLAVYEQVMRVKAS